MKTERGAALVEYGMIVGLIAVLSIGTVSTLGEEINGVFETAQQTLSSELSAADAFADKSGAEATTPEPLISGGVYTIAAGPNGYVEATAQGGNAIVYTGDFPPSAACAFLGYASGGPSSISSGSLGSVPGPSIRHIDGALQVDAAPVASSEYVVTNLICDDT